MGEQELYGTGPEEEGTPSEEGTAEPEATATEPAEGAEESFIDPRNLPTELKPHFKKMQGAFTQKMQGFKEVREKADLVDRFNSDVDFRAQVLQQAADQLGLTLARPGTGTAAPATPPPAPPNVVEAVKGSISPEYQFMASDLASAIMAVVKPLQAAREQDQANQRSREYDSAAEAMDEIAPGWQTHESDMDELLNFLHDGSKQRHPRFGLKHEILYNMVTGGQHAVRKAIRAQGDAAKAKTSTGTAAARSSTPNVEEKILKAPTFGDAFKEAAKAAEAELERGGHKVPS